MRSNDRLIIAAMMIVAFLIVVFLSGFIALILIEDSRASDVKRPMSGDSSFIPVASVTGDSYNVNSIENKGSVIEIIDKSSNDPNMASWNEYKENQDKQISKERFDHIVEQREEMKAAESDMESWCDQLHSNSCLETKYTWMDSGCKPVEIECKKFDDDDICFRYEVDIIDKFVDEKYCEN